MSTTVAPTHLPVYRVMTDSPPYIHHTILVETHIPSGTGDTYHMNGSIGSDSRPMVREYRRTPVRPEDTLDPPFVGREFLGVVKTEDYYGQDGEGCKAGVGGVDDDDDDGVEREPGVELLGKKEGGRFRSICDEVEEPTKSAQCMVWVNEAVALLRKRGVLAQAGNEQN